MFVNVGGGFNVLPDERDRDGCSRDHINLGTREGPTQKRHARENRTTLPSRRIWKSTETLEICLFFTHPGSALAPVQAENLGETIDEARSPNSENPRYSIPKESSPPCGGRRTSIAACDVSGLEPRRYRLPHAPRCHHERRHDLRSQYHRLPGLGNDHAPFGFARDHVPSEHRRHDRYRL